MSNNKFKKEDKKMLLEQVCCVLQTGYDDPNDVAKLLRVTRAVVALKNGTTDEKTLKTVAPSSYVTKAQAVSWLEKFNLHASTNWNWDVLREFILEHWSALAGKTPGIVDHCNDWLVQIVGDDASALSNLKRSGGPPAPAAAVSAASGCGLLMTSGRRTTTLAKSCAGLLATSWWRLRAVWPPALALSLASA